MGWIANVVGKVAGAVGIPNNTIFGKALASNLSATEKNARNNAKNDNPVMSALNNVSGNVRLGTDRLTGLIPFVIAGAIALAIAFGGGLFRFGKKRRR
jgi:hypothetical protein